MRDCGTPRTMPAAAGGGPTTMPPLPSPPAPSPLRQVDAEYDVSGKAADAARAAEEAARRLGEAAEDADARYQVRGRAQNLWRDIKRGAPAVRRRAWLACAWPACAGWSALAGGVQARGAGCWLQCMAARPGACIDHLPPPSCPALPQAGRAIRDFFETPLGAVTFLFLFLISVRRGAPMAAAHGGGVQCIPASVFTSRQPPILHTSATRRTNQTRPLAPTLLPGVHRRLLGHPARAVCEHVDLHPAQPAHHVSRARWVGGCGRGRVRVPTQPPPSHLTLPAWPPTPAATT